MWSNAAGSAARPLPASRDAGSAPPPGTRPCLHAPLPLVAAWATTGSPSGGGRCRGAVSVAPQRVPGRPARVMTRRRHADVATKAATGAEPGRCGPGSGLRPLVPGGGGRPSGVLATVPRSVGRLRDHREARCSASCLRSAQFVGLGTVVARLRSRSTHPGDVVDVTHERARPRAWS